MSAGRPWPCTFKLAGRLLLLPWEQSCLWYGNCRSLCLFGIRIAKECAVPVAKQCGNIVSSSNYLTIQTSISR
ncbi:hypothetical protein KP509_32G058800 [Ceratopteris richardii]|uniref:Uncharacterized protein n=1 Tax=Ceratopteris richardii TaxID=49495 RepID=A0A8T2QV60_CERRI|nr:hypothetical protein KP509_32G058800 [Ceratopteris richardii]